MKLSEVNKLRQVYTEEAVNNLLSEDYKLLKIFSTNTRYSDFFEVKPCYILGKKEKKQKAKENEQPIKK